MVLSCLVEPLVAPLVGRSTSGPGRRTALRRSRLAATALACSALMAIALPAGEAAVDHAEAEAAPAPNAHQKPAPIAYSAFLELIAARLDETITIAAPTEAAQFEQDALHAHRLRHARTGVHDAGPVLGRARTTHRLTRSVALSYLLFGSGRLRAGIPALV